jgi:predicted 2-oxoglutarate/Fe(II)-dependent dioxygenase YbiX
MIERGMRAPDFVLLRPDGTAARFYATAGGAPGLLIFADTVDDDAVAAAREAGGQVHVVVRRPPARDPGVPVLVDAEGRVAAAYGVTAPTVFALDPNLRVVADRAAPRQEPEPIVTAQAPVLYVPDVLDAATRAELIQVWEAQHEETGVERTSGGGRQQVLESAAKRRADHVVSDPHLLQTLTREVGRRVLPEVSKAFAYRARRFEGFKIACYDATSAGFFAAHRDNLSPATAQRRFALTLNLNDGYEGGTLRFPEYGRMRYRPAAGEALLFSCSHLHEVLPVTRGRRFVLLSFLLTDPPAPAG